MSTNRGHTSLRGRRRAGNKMAEFDRLPGELRGWLANAILPWGARSARRAYDRAMSRTNSWEQAVEELNLLQDKLVAHDARRVWGTDHPYAADRSSQ